VSRAWFVGAVDGKLPPDATLLDDDHVGGSSPRSAAEWCAEAVEGGGLEVWAAELSGARIAVALFNRTPDEEKITARWKEVLRVVDNASDFQTTSSSAGDAAGIRLAVRDVWKEEDVGVFAEGYTASVPGYGTVLLVVEKA
jgi:hypothetical protein